MAALMLKVLEGSCPEWAEERHSTGELGEEQGAKPL